VKRGRLAAALAVLLVAAFAAPGTFAATPTRAPAMPGTRSTAALRVAALSEHILKLQAQEGLRVLTPRGRRASGTALRELDAAVRAVGVPAAPAELHESAALLAILAADYRAWALKPATRENARKLAERAEEVAWEAQKVARLSTGATRPGAALAARAEEASALSQRVARLVLWKRWGVGGASADNALALARVELEAALRELGAANGPSAETLAELQLAENQVAFLLASARRIEEGAREGRELEFAAKASDNARESLERLAALYDGGP